MSRALLFDLDGTLVDSVADLTAALNRLLAELGRRAASGAEVRGWVGEGAAVLVGRALAGTGAPLEAGAQAAATARFVEIYQTAAAVHTRPYPGVVPALQALSARGAPMAVVTNKPYLPTLAVLDALDLRRFFAVVIGADSTPTRKPDGGPLRAALARLGATDGVMIGDSRIDVAAARAAGLPAVLVAWGYAHGDPAEIGADRVITRAEELVDLADP